MESLFSQHWYRVADQRPRLRDDIRVQRKRVRGQAWYLLVNAVNGRHYRVNEQAYRFLGRCDGERSVQQVWDALLEQFRDDAPTQDDVIRTLGQLDEHELLIGQSAPDERTLVRRRAERDRQRIQGFVNPFALRIPLGDPSSWLRRLDGLGAVVFSTPMLYFWLAAMTIALATVASNWDALSTPVDLYSHTSRYLLLAWIGFPFVKALHELGHALAVRRWGGEVHEVGFSLFVLLPAPYVDASAAAAFRPRYQRVLVGAAGIMVELMLAALALAVWLNVQPGLVRDLAFVTLFIASVSTLLFNGNPLLPLDAYHVMCDALDLPNLAARSKNWWLSRIEHALARLSRAPANARDTLAAMQVASGEAKWLVLYAPASFVYRILLSWLIVLWVGAHSAVLGVLAALLAVGGLIVKPVWSFIARLLPAAHGNRSRGAAVLLLVTAALAALVAWLPLPLHTVTSGVVWPPDEARVRAGTDGFIVGLTARDGDRVTPGQPLLQLEDPALIAARDKATARLEQLEAGRFTALLASPEKAREAEDQIARTQSELERIEQRIAQLQVRAQAAGTLVMPHQEDLLGTLARQGATLAYVLEDAVTRVRVAVPEYDAALVRDHTLGVEVRAAAARETVAARVVRDTPAATFELPSAALGDRGGGPYRTDPADQNGLRTLQPVVLIDLKVPSHALQRIGDRVWVRFDHPAQSLAQRSYRRIRQALLQHFDPND